MPARNLLTHLQRLLQPIDDSSLTEMESEFKVIGEKQNEEEEFLFPYSD